MTGPPPEHTLRAAHALHLLRFVEQEHGIAADGVLAPLGLQLTTLSATDAVIRAADMGALMGRAKEVTGDPQLSLKLALRAQLPLLGYLGFALMTANSVEQALRLAGALAPSQTTAVRPQLQVMGEHAAVQMWVSEQFGDAREELLAGLMIGLAGALSSLTGRCAALRVELQGTAAQSWLQSGLLPEGVTLTYGASCDRLCLDTSLLQAPIRSADPVALELVVARCRELLAQRHPDEGLVARARHWLSQQPSGQLSPEGLASALGVSPRALRRRLSEVGVSYRELRDGVILQQALLLLQRPGLSLAEIAAALGYADAASFSRAFVRWTGKTPGQYREG